MGNAGQAPVAVDAEVANGAAGGTDPAIAMGVGANTAYTVADVEVACGAGWPCCELSHVGDVVVLTLRNPSVPAFGEVLNGLLSEVCIAKRLVIDVRGCRGGMQEDIFPLVPFVLAPGTTATPEQLFSNLGNAMNYSRHNVDDKLKELEMLRTQAREGTSVPEDLAELDELAADLQTKRGQKLLLCTLWFSLIAAPARRPSGLSAPPSPQDTPPSWGAPPSVRLTTRALGPSVSTTISRSSCLRRHIWKPSKAMPRSVAESLPTCTFPGLPPSFRMMSSSRWPASG